MNSVSTSNAVDLVCWDFGDTLVDEMFMRIAPIDVPQWATVYEEVLDERPEWVEDWMLGRVSMNDLIPLLVDRLPMTAEQVAHHLRWVWTQIVWFEDSRQLIERIPATVAQAIVTVNPHEFHGIATACGLDPLVPTMVTSADLETASKPAMAVRAREILGLPVGLGTTVLIDNRADNVAAFEAAGGHAVLCERDNRSLIEVERLLGLV